MNEPDYREAARKLWMLLDDIDTLDDVCRADDAAFRKHARSVQRKRFDVLSGEQFDALAASPCTPENAEKDTSNGVPAFNKTLPCILTTADPTRTVCLRCMNPHHACDHPVYGIAAPTPCPECHNANWHYEGCGRGFGTSGTTDGVKLPDGGQQ